MVLEIIDEGSNRRGPLQSQFDGGVAMTLTGRATDPHHVPCIIEEADEGILGNGDRPGECRNHAGGCPTLNTTAEQPILFEVETDEDTDVPCKHSTECGTN